MNLVNGKFRQNFESQIWDPYYSKRKYLYLSSCMRLSRKYPGLFNIYLSVDVKACLRCSLGYEF